MRVYALVLIACGSAIGLALILRSVRGIGLRIKKNQETTTLPTVNNRGANYGYSDTRDVERSKTTRVTSSSGVKDGGLAVLGGAGAALATAAVVASLGGNTSGGYIRGSGGCGHYKKMDFFQPLIYDSSK